MSTSPTVTPSWHDIPPEGKQFITLMIWFDPNSFKSVLLWPPAVKKPVNSQIPAITSNIVCLVYHCNNECILTNRDQLKRDVQRVLSQFLKLNIDSDILEFGLTVFLFFVQTGKVCGSRTASRQFRAWNVTPAFKTAKFLKISYFQLNLCVLFGRDTVNLGQLLCWVKTWSFKETECKCYLSILLCRDGWQTAMRCVYNWVFLIICVNSITSKFFWCDRLSTL